MFGGKRRRAQEAALEAVQPFVTAIASTGGIPTGFWEDPFVLGFFNGCISAFAKLATQGKIAGVDLGLVLMSVYDSVTGGNGRETGLRAHTFIEKQEPDFIRGLDNAIKLVAFTYGLADLSDDPDVIEATKVHEAVDASLSGITGPISETSAVAGALSHILFYDVVQERFGETRR